MPSDQQTDHVEAAQAALDSIGGIRENGSAELAPIAQAHASIAIAEQLKGIRGQLGSIHGELQHIRSVMTR